MKCTQASCGLWRGNSSLADVDLYSPPALDASTIKQQLNTTYSYWISRDTQYCCLIYHNLWKTKFRIDQASLSHAVDRAAAP